ncbi:hypothetical protein RJ639_031319, partial [Escallonia herrerae]
SADKLSFEKNDLKNSFPKFNLGVCKLHPKQAAMRLSFLSLVVLLVSSIALFSLLEHAKAEVITLTADTFTDKNLGSLWDDMGKAVEGEDEIEIGQVDCGADKPLCSKVDIHSYPTFKLFYNGEEVARYQGGPRDVESLKTFVLEETEKAATKSQEDDDSKEL